ncbi:MAG: hypothetical protein ABI967_12895 [bacterium]
MRRRVAKVAVLVRYQWRAYWRRLRRASTLSASNQGIVLLLLGLVFVKYLQLLNTASAGLTRGKTSLLQSLLTGIFIAWLFPLASGDRVNVSSRRLLHLPLSLQQLFVVRLISLLIPPTSWMIVAGSLAICYPILQATNSAAGILAALLFIGVSWQAGVTVSQLASIAFWRKLFAATTTLGLLLAASLFRSRGYDAQSLIAVSRYNPTLLVVDAAMGEQPWLAIATLALLLLLASSAAFWSFRQSLAVPAKSRTRKIVLFDSFKIPGRLSGLVAKDVRYFRRLLDPYFGLLASFLCGLHLVIAEAPSPDVFRLFILIVFVANSAVGFNLFGLDDRSGLDRYAILPLTGTATLLSKNLAFAVLLSAQLCPMFLLAFWCLGLSASVLGVVEATSLAAAYLAWGNWMSVNQPVKLQFYRFSSSGAALADSIGGIIFGSVPGVVAIYFLRDQARVPWAVVVMGFVYAAILVLSLLQFGKQLESKREAIAAAVS